MEEIAGTGAILDIFHVTAWNVVTTRKVGMDQGKTEAQGLVPPCFQQPMDSPRAATLRVNEDLLGLCISSKVEGVDINFLVDTGLNITILSPGVMDQCT